jgi:hypothetical protein
MNLTCPSSMAAHAQKVLRGECEDSYHHPDPVILDIGAKVGSFAMWAIERRPSGFVHHRSRTSMVESVPGVAGTRRAGEGPAPMHKETAGLWNISRRSSRPTLHHATLAPHYPPNPAFLRFLRHGVTRKHLTLCAKKTLCAQACVLARAG